MSKNRFEIDHFQPLAEEAIPRHDLVSRPAEPVAEAVDTPPRARAIAPGQGRGVAEVPALPRGIKKAEPASEKSDSLRQLATQRFTPIAEKRGTSLRLEPWLDNELNKRMYFLKAEGYRKITREAIISEALIQYLGLTPPPIETE